MIEIVSHGNVAVFNLKYGKANLQDIEFCQELIRWLDELRNSDTRAIVLTGTGKIFSAGVDLTRVLNGGPNYLREFLPVLSQLFETVFFYPKPVISAINGHAVAGGCVLACAADYRVMSLDTGRIGVPEMLVGVPFPTIAMEIMRFVSDPQRLEELLYSGAVFPPESAYSRGLANKVVEPDRLLDHSIGVAENLAALPPHVFALTKRQVRAPILKRLQEEGPGFDKEVHALWSSHEGIESMRNYVFSTLKKS